MAFDQIKYIADYNKEKYDRVEFRVPKGRKSDIQELAKREGKSVAEVVVYAIEKTYGINLSN